SDLIRPQLVCLLEQVDNAQAFAGPAQRVFATRSARTAHSHPRLAFGSLVRFDCRDFEGRGLTVGETGRGQEERDSDGSPWHGLTRRGAEMFPRAASFPAASLKGWPRQRHTDLIARGSIRLEVKDVAISRLLLFRRVCLRSGAWAPQGRQLLQHRTGD